MRLITKTEDNRIEDEISYLRNLVAERDEEVKRLRAQIDEARDIPPYLFDVTGKQEAKVHVMSDKRMTRQQNGEPVDDDAS